jgi:hypothetical protein
MSPCHLSKNIKIKIYKTPILSLVLYGCETGSVTQRKNIAWGCFSTVLCKIFGPNREGIPGGGRRMKIWRLWWCSGSRISPGHSSWRRFISGVLASVPLETVFNGFYVFAQSNPKMSFILTTYFYITHCMPHTDVLTR